MNCSLHADTPLVVVSFCPRCRGKAGGSAKTAKKKKAAQANGKRRKKAKT